MPTTKAAMKALRQTKKNALRNKTIKNSLRDLIRRSRRSMTEKKLDEAKNLISQAIKAADKAVRAKIIKQNTASRLKSRLTKKLGAIMKK